MSVFLQPIYTQTVGSGGAASITFNNIPQTFTDLKVVISARSTQAAIVQSMPMGFNANAAGAVFSQTWIVGDGLYVSSSRYGSNVNLYPFYINGANATANTFGNGEIYISNYSSTTTYKSIICDGITETNAASGLNIQLNAMLYSSNTAVSSITLYGNPSFVQYSTFTLYGVLRQGI